MEKTIRSIFKWLGDLLNRFDFGGIMSLLISVLVLRYTGFKIENITLFISTGIGVFVICQILGHLFIWISKKIILLEISAVEDKQKSPRLLNLEITNKYKEDFTDTRIELKRLTIVGQRVDAQIENRQPFFQKGKRIDGDKIRSGDTSAIYLVEIPIGEEDKFFVDFLTEPVWRGNYIYGDLSADEAEKRYGELAGVIYEFVVEISGKIDNEYIVPQVYKGSIRYLSLNEKTAGWTPGIHWIRFDKYSMKEEGKRSTFRQDDEMIRGREDFWRMLTKLSIGNWKENENISPARLIKKLSEQSDQANQIKQKNESPSIRGEELHGQKTEVKEIESKKVEVEEEIDIPKSARQMCRLAEEFSSSFRHVRDAFTFDNEKESNDVWTARQEVARTHISKLLEIFQATKYHFDCRVDLEKNIVKLSERFGQYIRIMKLYRDMRTQQAMTPPATPLPYGNLDNYVNILFGEKATNTFNEVDSVVESIIEMLTPYIRGENANVQGKELLSVHIEAPFTLRSPYRISEFLVRNDGTQKLFNCYAKLEVLEVRPNNAEGFTFGLPLSSYPKKILWQSGKETIDLRENDKNYLHVLELGKHNFRFLFYGGIPLSAGEFEPEDLPREQTEWLSHKFHTIKVTLYGDDINGKSIEFQKEFALIFMILDNNYTKLIKAIPVSSCVMKIREITSYENIENYFEW